MNRKIGPIDLVHKLELHYLTLGASKYLHNTNKSRPNGLSFRSILINHVTEGNNQVTLLKKLPFWCEFPVLY